MPGFSPERLRRLGDMERTHFWFTGRRRLIGRLVERFLPPAPGRILELGPGMGSNIEDLSQRGYRVTAVDLLADVFSELQRRAPGIQLVQADSADLPIREESFEGAVALDVLEHVDDRKTLFHLHRVLRPAGVLMLTVPAFPFLWSYRDVAAGHIRRYRKQGLVSILNEAGFSVKYFGYYQFFLFMLAIISRFAGKRSPLLRDFEDLPPRPLNSMFSRINRIEVDLGRRVRWPMGSSLVVVCQKRPA
jgi:SAM-dependent methyltransferase